MSLFKEESGNIFMNPKPNAKEDKAQRKINLMIRQELSSGFNLDQWREIKATSPKVFLKNQEKILHYLLINNGMFFTYFQRFYTNHSRLYHWCLLASQKHQEIKEYVFKKLLNKKLKEYKENILSLIHLRQITKQKSRQEKMLREKTQCKETIDEMSKKLFKLLSDNSHQARSQSPAEKSSCKTSQLSRRAMKNCYSVTNRQSTLHEHKTKKVQIYKSQDFHDLYVKTFHACDGQRYIFYNHEKHMKGMSEKNNYNSFIRRSNHGTSNFQREFFKSQQKQEFYRKTEIRNNQNEPQSENMAIINYQPYGKDSESKKYKSKMVFRRFKRSNIGKFIRK